MNRIAREGGVIRVSLPCRHYLRLSDCLLNQVLLGGLLFAAGCAQSPALKVALRRLADVLAVSVRSRPLHRYLVAQAIQSLDRMAAAYAPALTLISREMLYQLAMYALSQPRGAVATILYPTTFVEARPARIEIGEALGGWNRASIVLQPVHLDHLDRVIAGGHSAANERQEFARRLVFGAAADSA